MMQGTSICPPTPTKCPFLGAVNIDALEQAFILSNILIANETEINIFLETEACVPLGNNYLS